MIHVGIKNSLFIRDREYLVFAGDELTHVRLGIRGLGSLVRIHVLFKSCACYAFPANEVEPTMTFHRQLAATLVAQSGIGSSRNSR